MEVLTMKNVVPTIMSALVGACSPVEVPIVERNPPQSDEEPPPVILGWAGEPNDGSDAGGAQMPVVSYLLDDFEDGDEKANEPFDWWYRVNDGSGVQEMAIVSVDGLAVSGDLGSGLVLELSSRDFTEWGAGWGLDISQVDISGVALELSFSIAANRNVEISFHALDGSEDHFTRTLLLTPSWSRFVVRLDELVVVDADAVRAFETTTATELHWFIFDNAATTIWLDDAVLRWW